MTVTTTTERNIPPMGTEDDQEKVRVETHSSSNRYSLSPNPLARSRTSFFPFPFRDHFSNLSIRVPCLSLDQVLVQSVSHHSFGHL